MKSALPALAATLVIAAMACDRVDPAAAKHEVSFIDEMLRHHPAAVAMAEFTAARTSDRELKAIAMQVAADQNAESRQLARWRERWYRDVPRAGETRFPTPEAARLHLQAVPRGRDLDEMFAQMMIPYQQAAIDLARESEPRVRHRQLKRFCREVVAREQERVRRLERWRAKSRAS